MSTTKGKKIALVAGCTVLLVLTLVVWACWDEILFCVRFESLGRNDQGYPEYRHRQTGIIFVGLPGGTFWMGISDEEKKRAIEKAQKDVGLRLASVAKSLQAGGPRHQVTLSPFLIAKYELRLADWKDVMGRTPAAGGATNLPVTYISWENCQEFCRQTGLTVPSEAQWEYACRAGSEGPYGGTGKLEEMGWYGLNSGRKLHARGEKGPNAFGLYDMHGNLFEWCQDVFDEDYYGKAGAPQLDPVCTSGSVHRVLRGGSWNYKAVYARSDYRFFLPPSSRDGQLGFRPGYDRG